MSTTAFSSRLKTKNSYTNELSYYSSAFSLRVEIVNATCVGKNWFPFGWLLTDFMYQFNLLAMRFFCPLFIRLYRCCRNWYFIFFVYLCFWFGDVAPAAAVTVMPNSSICYQQCYLVVSRVLFLAS